MDDKASSEATRGAGLTIALCFAVAILEGFDIQAIGVSAHKIAHEFGLRPGQIGWVFFASNLALVIGASFGGLSADRFGRKPVFVCAVLTFGVATYATTWVFDFWSLSAARALAGVGFGAALPNLMAVAADISLPERRTSTATAMFCGTPLGGGLVAAYTQLLPNNYGWRILFEVGGALPIVLAPLLLLFLRETNTSRDRDIRRKPRIFTALFGAGRAVPTLLLWIAFFPTLGVLYLVLYWLPTLVAAKGLGAEAGPLASVAFNFASIVGALFLGRVVDRYGPRRPLTIAFALLIAVIFGLAAVNGLVPVLLLSGGLGLLLLGANYALYGVAASYYPKPVRGTGSGAAIAVGRVGAIIGPLLPGLLLSAGSSADDIIKLMAPAAAMAGVAVFALSFFKPMPED